MQEDGCQKDHALVMVGEFFIAGSDTTAVLEPVEEAFNPVSQTVESFVKDTLLKAVAFAGNNCFHALFFQKIQKGIGVIPFVCNQDLARSVSKHSLSLTNVGGLTGSQAQIQQLTTERYQRMQLT